MIHLTYSTFFFVVFYLFIFLKNHVEMGQLKLKANIASRQVISGM